MTDVEETASYSARSGPTGAPLGGVAGKPETAHHTRSPMLSPKGLPLTKGFAHS